MSSTKPPNTIFLTPEEAERLRETLQGRLQKCQTIAGQPRVPSDPNFTLNQVATASFLSDFAGTPELGLKAVSGRPDAIAAFAVGRPYLPCSVSVRDLQPMALSDLRMDTHHRGCVLTLQRVAPVVKLVVFSWTVVREESSGETERLEVLLHKSKHGQDILESGSIYKIKEPYFTLSDQGDRTLRIDHPSDLVICTDISHTDSEIPSTTDDGESHEVVSAGVTAAKTNITAAQCKEKGNAALKQQSLLLAHASYTQGLNLLTIDQIENDDLGHDLFRNRAYVNLVLDRLDEAKADALSSLTNLGDQKHKDLDNKGFFRAGCAAYNLGEFQDAKRFFEEQQKLMPGDKDARVHLRTTKIRLQEQSIGVYDFKRIKASLSVAHPRIDAASFTRNVKVGKSPGHGRGLFATRSLKPGDIILCEKAFCVVWGHEVEALTVMTFDGRDNRIRVFPAGLCKSIMQKLLNNPTQFGKVMDLYGDYRGNGKQLIMCDSRPVVDSFQVHDIVARNAFGSSAYFGPHYGGEDVNNESAGLWITASYINHSCIPNAKKELLGDLLILRATRLISTGDEITHSYDASSDYDTRSARLMNTWGFLCTCALCNAEKLDSPDIRQRRQELETKANALVESIEAVGAKRISIVKARAIARSISDTYDDERYNGLPRMSLLTINEWLAEAISRSGERISGPEISPRITSQSV